MPKTIVFTGGGTAGHVTPNLALIEVMQQKSWKIAYIGSKNGVEKTIVSSLNVPYYSIRSGKLRRYFSWKNFVDPFNILCGILQSYLLLQKIKPNIVFSKGGFVSFPVVVSAWMHRIPVIIHESDMSPGLANRLSFPFAKQICVTFENSKKYFKTLNKVVVTGTPIRPNLLSGNKNQGLAQAGFTSDKPCVLIMGGSQGSQLINRCVRSLLKTLSHRFNVIHLCGKGNVDTSLIGTEGYYQLEYAQHELADLFSASDVIVSRSGANSLCEILALKKPHVLIPLSRQSSRGDQIQNAQYFERLGISVVIAEEALTARDLELSIEDVLFRQEVIIKNIEALNLQSGTQSIVNLIQNLSQ